MLKFNCECGSNLIEEVMSDVTQYAVVNDVEILEDGSLCMDYGNTNTEGGDINSIYYQCVKCGREVLIDELKSCVE